MMREKTTLLDEFVSLQIGIKYFWLKVFYYFSEKLLFLKIYMYATSEEAVCHNSNVLLPSQFLS